MRCCVLSQLKTKHEVTGAVKLIYEIHGNTIPHLHVHLFPRYKGDLLENGPINPRLIKESPYGAGEFENFTRTLQARLSEN
jgi:diadenosine tetraphosphate (Ap4A) HIT family hydrolase